MYSEVNALLVKESIKIKVLRHMQAYAVRGEKVLNPEALEVLIEREEKQVNAE